MINSFSIQHSYELLKVVSSFKTGMFCQSICFFLRISPDSKYTKLVSESDG